jgi:hypothetical protein
MISYHFLNQTSRANFFTNDTAHGAGQLWSSVPLLPSWQQHLVPFPIIQADSQPVGSNLTTLSTSTVYEVNFSRSLRMTKWSLMCNADDPHGVWILGSSTFRDGKHHLRRDALNQWTTG